MENPIEKHNIESFYIRVVKQNSLGKSYENSGRKFENDMNLVPYLKW